MSDQLKLQLSSMKLEINNQKGIVYPTVHIYEGTTDEELENIRRQTLEQFKKLIIDVNKAGFNMALGASE